MSSLSNWIQRRVENFVRDQRKKPNAVRVLAEGDSWFSYGGWMWGGKTLIEQLNDYQTVNLVSIAQPGAELEGMVEPRNRRQWVLATNPDWLDDQKYDVVLISGGGNDVVGDELPSLLFERSDTRKGKDQVKKSALETAFRIMHSHLDSIRNTVDQRIGTGTPILMHGYDYAQPSGRAFEMLGGLITVGPWIKHSLVFKGVVDDDEQREIVNFLIDQFNEFLGKRETDIADFHYLDVRGTLDANDWADELHPTTAGRQKLAQVFRQGLVDVAGAG